MTPDRLNSIALYYLRRFASSSENLRRVLRRRALAAARHNGTEPEEAEPWIEEVVARCIRAGLLDDRAYARARADSLMRRGNSLRTIRAKLAAKGVAADDIDAAMDELAEETGDAEKAAARAYARRRRLGPFGPESERAANRARDLAAMARAGFGYDVALEIVDGARDELDR